MSITENDYDFGFSFTDENEALSAVQSQPISNTATSDDLRALQEKIDSILVAKNQEVESANAKIIEERYKVKLKDVENLILPLLYNLMKNPEKAYIKWENRTEIIQKQINKIIAITRS